MAVTVAGTLMHYYALTTETDNVWNVSHKRNDEVFTTIALSHEEGDFAVVTATIKNPRRPWLMPEMNVWLWLAKNDTPYFFGRLDAIPENISGELVQMKFVARSSDYEAQKIALATTLHFPPFVDDVWINADQVDNPDNVLNGRSALFHVDRQNHIVSISDIINGEDGTIVIENHFYDSLMVSRSSAPIQRVRIDAEVSWPQTAVGTVDITKFLKAAFTEAGSVDSDDKPTGRMSSFTGQGLQEDHPDKFDDLKGGWTMGDTSLTRVDGVAFNQRYKDVTIQGTTTKEDAWGEAVLAAPYKARFYLWEFVPTMYLNYSAVRQRIEYLSLEVSADMQNISRDDAELFVLPIQSKRVAEPIDPDGAMPIGSLHSNSYFLQERGKQSIETLIMFARAKLLANARAIEISVAYTFDFGLQYSCRKNAVINDPRLPNGQATGKIVKYTLVVNNKGQEFSTVTIGCAVGRGNTVEAVEGETEYGDEDWDEDYQERVGTWLMPEVGDLVYEDFNDVEIGNSYEIDGVTYYDNANFDRFDIKPFISNFEVVNGEAVQRAVLSNTFTDIPEAIVALNEVHTEVILELEPIDKVGPFITNYVVNVSPLQVPRLFDAEYTQE